MFFATDTICGWSYRRIACGMYDGSRYYYWWSIFLEKALYQSGSFIRISNIVHWHCTSETRAIAFRHNFDRSVMEKTSDPARVFSAYGFYLLSLDRVATREHSRLIYEYNFSWDNDIIVHFEIHHSFSIPSEKKPLYE